ncbi:MAG: hypothetical protein ACR2HP_11930 [Ilumatobacteraceae bacterium]
MHAYFTLHHADQRQAQLFRRPAVRRWPQVRRRRSQPAPPMVLRLVVLADTRAGDGDADRRVA